MKRSISSVLVIVITVISLVAMYSFRADVALQTNVPQEDETVDFEVPDGTGHIFDDYGKNINIPVNETEEKTNTEDSKDENKDSMGSYYYGPYGNNNYRNMANIEYNSESQSEADYSDTAAASPALSTSVSKSLVVEKKYDMTVDKAKSLPDFKEKLFLLGIARHFNLEDFKMIKEYIVNGATQKELDNMWSRFKDKMPAKDYDRLYEIFLKYKQ